MADTKRVYVYTEEGFIDSYKVFPAVTILKKNDSIELVNITLKRAEWNVPAGVLEDSAIHEDVEPGQRKSKTARKDGPRGGTYKVKVDGKDAHGHSDPAIIIDL
jgi:hypothetical protein